MSKTIPTVCVTEIGDESKTVLKINKCDFDKSKFKVVRQPLSADADCAGQESHDPEAPSKETGNKTKKVSRK